MPVTQLTNRAVLRLSGPDAKPFLQGLVSNDVMLAAPDNAVYAALLTPQGKFLHDMFIQDTSDGLLLDVEADRLDDLQQRLLRHKLRAKITLEPDPSLKIFAGWGEPRPAAAVPDPRLPQLGWRIVSHNQNAPTSFIDYDHHRLQLGVADGSRDLEIEKSTLQEGNFDLLNGISFTKGCYLGQELTARIHYRGLVKKRLMPVLFSGPAPASSTEILAENTPVGEVRSQCGDIALGLISLNALTAPALTLSAAGISGKIMMPEWLKLPS